jgi:XTP/dITP diphosphohydrolase|tara:strand:- start:223 stop:798 length:576 start_codon:yes stop_codon:yes gene_type:complete
MEIILATKNKNKFIEIKAIFDKSDSKHEIIYYPDLIDVIEDKETILENAKKKALEVFDKYQRPVIADDSGLFVKALNGHPGVKSARYAGEEANDQDNINKLLKELENEDNRSASFKTILFFYDGKNEITAEGDLNGDITLKSRGDNGFGYDPVFQVQDGRTLAELTLDEKSEISHRRVACIKMIELLNEEI